MQRFWLFFWGLSFGGLVFLDVAVELSWTCYLLFVFLAFYLSKIRFLSWSAEVVLYFLLEFFQFLVYYSLYFVFKAIFKILIGKIDFEIQNLKLPPHFLHILFHFHKFLWKFQKSHIVIEAVISLLLWKVFIWGKSFEIFFALTGRVDLFLMKGIFLVLLIWIIFDLFCFLLPGFRHFTYSTFEVFLGFAERSIPRTIFFLWNLQIFQGHSWVVLRVICLGDENDLIEVGLRISKGFMDCDFNDSVSLRKWFYFKGLSTSLILKVDDIPAAEFIGRRWSHFNLNIFRVGLVIMPTVKSNFRDVWIFELNILEADCNILRQSLSTIPYHLCKEKITSSFSLRTLEGSQSCSSLVEEKSIILAPFEERQIFVSVIIESNY